MRKRAAPLSAEAVIHCPDMVRNLVHVAGAAFTEDVSLGREEIPQRALRALELARKYRLLADVHENKEVWVGQRQYVDTVNFTKKARIGWYSRVMLPAVYRHYEVKRFFQSGASHPDHGVGRPRPGSASGWAARPSFRPARPGKRLGMKYLGDYLGLDYHAFGGKMGPTGGILTRSRS